MEVIEERTYAIKPIELSVTGILYNGTEERKRKATWRLATRSRHL